MTTWLLLSFLVCFVIIVTLIVLLKSFYVYNWKLIGYIKVLEARLQELEKRDYINTLEEDN